MRNILCHTLGGRLLLAGLLAGSTWAVWSSRPEASHAQPERVAAPAAVQKFGYVGTASCGSTACHNAGGAPGSTRSEYSTWMQRDKHIRAYDVLLSERSKTILMNLRGLKEIKEAQPQKDMTCLQCHAMDPHGAQQGQSIAYEDGIGCERCHGPAQKWLSQHFTSAWKSKSNEEKATLGFVPTRSAVARAQMCVDCHVGTPGLDVNHDLIAAGHPRLTFEYSSYLANMPPHWNMSAEKQRQPDLEARNWAVGQVVSAHKAMELLAARAKADDVSPHKAWPEFGEYDCYACHNPIQFSGNWPVRTKTDKPAGSLTMADWYWTMVPRALTLARSGDAAKVQAALQELQKEMNQQAPDRAKVATLAQTAAEQLQQAFAPLGRMGTLDPAALREALAEIHKNEKSGSWDRAAQTYAAIVALHQAMGDYDPNQRDPKLAVHLRDLSAKLQFRTGFDSPRPDDLAEFWKRFAQLPVR